MSLQLETTVKRFRGLSTDEKPGHERAALGEPLQKIPIGSTFTEIDTGRRYVWAGAWPWLRQEQTVEALLLDLIDVALQVLSVLESIKAGHEEYLWGDKME